MGAVLEKVVQLRRLPRKMQENVRRKEEGDTDEMKWLLIVGQNVPTQRHLALSTLLLST